MNSDTQDLIDRYVDGSASAEEIRHINELVRQDPSVRHSLLMSASMQLDLRLLLTTTRDDATTAPREEERRRRDIAWGSILGRAAVLLLAVTGWIAAMYFATRYHFKCNEQAAAMRTIAALDSSRRDGAKRDAQEEQIPAGRVVQTRGTVLVLPEGKEEAMPVSVGLPIPTGRSLWTCPWGAAAMRFSDGVSLDLDRNTVATISQVNGVRQVALKRGIAFVTQLDDAPEHKLIVTTDNGSVTVTDAQVAVEVNSRGTTVEVAQGKVRVMRKPDEPGVVVSAGQYAIVGNGIEPRAVDGRLLWRLEPSK